MARVKPTKSKPAKKAATSSKAKLSWPKTHELLPWLIAYLDFCERSGIPIRAASSISLRLVQLAECGDASGAIKRLQRFLSQLPASECESTAWLATHGMKIALEIPDLKLAQRMEKISEDRQATAKPRVKNWIKMQVKELKLGYGVETDGPQDDDDALTKIGKIRKKLREEERTEKKSALSMITKMTKYIPDVDHFWQEPGLVLSAINAFRKYEGDAAVAKYVDWLDKNKESRSLDTGSLMSIGFPDLAKLRAEKFIKQKLKKLKSSDDPNIHFDVNDICEQLWFLIQVGEKPVAQKLLKQTLSDLPKWPGLRGGFAGAGALTYLAEVLAETDGSEAAIGLLQSAVQAGNVERNRGFRGSALKSANEAIACPSLAQRIAQATLIKNSKKRRETIIPLLVRASDWTQLAEVLNEITDSQELIHSLHSVLNELPGGSRLMS